MTIPCAGPRRGRVPRGLRAYAAPGKDSMMSHPGSDTNSPPRHPVCSVHLAGAAALCTGHASLSFTVSHDSAGWLYLGKTRRTSPRYVTKPALAPKPQGLDGFGAVSLNKCSSPLISKAGLDQQRKSTSRGPKPPIAPKPVLSPAAERRRMEDTNNSLNKCTNGEAAPPADETCDSDEYSLDCSESDAADMTYEDYITAPPGSQLTDTGSTDSECGKTSSSGDPPADPKDEASCGPSAAGEEDSGHPESAPLGDTESGDSTEVDDSDNTDALSLRSSSTAEADSLAPHCDTPQFKDDLGNMEDFLPSDINEDSMENEDGESDMKMAGCSDVILLDMSLDDLPVPEETNPEEKADCGTCWDDATCNDYPVETCDATEGSAEGDLEEAGSLQARCDEEPDLAAETTDEAKDIAEDSCKLNEAPLTDSNNAEEAEQPESQARESSEAPQGDPEEVEEHEGTAEDLEEEDNVEDSCQIIPFENEINEDAEPLEEVVSRIIMESETTEPRGESFCQDVRCDQEVCHMQSSRNVPRRSAATEGSNAWHEGPSGLTHGEVVEGDGADTAETSPEDQEGEVKEPLTESAEGTSKTGQVTEAEDEDDSNPYVLEDSVQSRTRKLLRGDDSAQVDKEANRPHCVMAESGSEGESHLMPVDIKNIVTRTRSYSGKIPGNVPETVPEETSAEIDSQTSTRESQERNTGDKAETRTGRTLPRKPSRFILYPRSYSVEGRENTVSLYLESDVPNFSPYVISSSGSFSQKNHHSSSGLSTPSSVVDIPPPFELASITKKPITKSSPSLLIETESAEKTFKKKKLSFKRFLTLKFKKKTENKVHVDVNVSSSRSSSESSYHGSSRLMDLDRRSLSNSPQLPSRSGMPYCPDSPSAILFYKDMKRKGTSKAFNRSVARVESFEDRSRPPFMPLPLTKPRSISFPNADTSDYENIPAMSSDYENVQIPPRRPGRASTFTEFFEDPCRALLSANENDGYVDMSSFNTSDVKSQMKDQDAESAYTEPYKACPVSVSAAEDVTSEEELKSSEDESSENALNQKRDGPSRALRIAEELLASEKTYVETLKRLHTEFHVSVLRVLGSEEEDGEEELKLRHGLSQLQCIYVLHVEVLQDLEARVQHWEENQKIANVFLSRESWLRHHTAFIVAFDKTTAALDDCVLKTPLMASVVREFERKLHCGQTSVKHELLKVVQRVFQYHMILTDYLNNLCPDWLEYEDTQAALLIVSEIADRANDSMRHGENLQKLIQIEYSVRGQSGLVQPGRDFVKEGTLMKVSGKNRHPRHLFLMNDVLLYTFPQKDGKYRSRNTLSIPGMRVSRPIVESVQNVLRIECMEGCLMLSASSCSERDDWFSCISRTVQEYYKAPTVSVYHNVELRERPAMCLGERPPSVAHTSHVAMCMNCNADFSLTLRRHHCHACGKIVCRSCSRNKYPLKYLRNQPAKVCDGCYTELRRRELAAMNPNSSPQSHRSYMRPLSAMFHISPSTMKKQRKIPSALMEAAASGENASISGYLHRCKKGKKYWKKRWFVIKGKVLFTYTACEDKVATESLPLLGFRIVPDDWDKNPKLGTVFQLHHKDTLFYSFKAADTSSAIRWVDAMKAATML